MKTTAAGIARAVWFPEPRTVELRDEPLRPPGAREVTVRSVASAISHGTEMLVYRGEVPSDLTLDLPTLTGGFDFPIKYGYASVGRVESAGTEVQTVDVGDLVFVHHPHQTAYTVAADLVTPLPRDASPEQAVFLANLETAVNVLLDAPVRVGETVVIFGQGVVGLLLTQLARRTAAAAVIAVDPVRRRRELSLSFRARAALDPSNDDVKSLVFDWTAGRGADLVVEACGDPGALQSAIDLAAPEATIVVVSWYGSKPARLVLGEAFHRRRLRLVSSQVGALAGEVRPRWDVRRRREVAADLLRDLTLTPLISHRFPFERAADAYALIDRHPDETVQVILTYGQASD